jgi:hypothetical protein
MTRSRTFNTFAKITFAAPNLVSATHTIVIRDSRECMESFFDRVHDRVSMSLLRERKICSTISNNDCFYPLFQEIIMRPGAGQREETIDGGNNEILKNSFAETRRSELVLIFSHQPRRYF